MSQDIDRLYQRTKGRLFFKKGAGFLGNLLARLNMVWTEEIETVCISSKTLYWNPTFFLSLDEETRITVLAHELWHNALLHGARLKERCPDIWNIAGDHVINLLLKEHGYYMGGFPYVMDDKYAKWSTDEIYDDLINNGPKPLMLPGSLTAGQLPDQAGQYPLGADVMPIEGDAIQEAVASVVGAMASAGISGTKPGDIPGEVTLVIDQFLFPKLPWETILFNFFNAMTSEEYSYSRPNRRYEDPLLPGITGRNGLEHLIYYLDISGSITDDHILRFNSEVKFIQEELKPEKLTLATFDTKIQDEYVFEREEPFEKITVTGRGGTSLKDVWRHAQEHQPTAMIVFTDLEVEIPENPGVPIIWVCIENPKMTVPYGQLIHLNG